MSTRFCRPWTNRSIVMHTCSCITDLQFSSDSLVITRSKVDQEGEGRKLGIPYGSNPDTCPERSLKAWLGFHGAQFSTGMIIWCRRQQNRSSNGSGSMAHTLPRRKATPTARYSLLDCK